ncbi:MAG TPA: response regulator [Rubrivivax sp.]|nr:response regulator [Rubrivivax sp.]
MPDEATPPELRVLIVDDEIDTATSFSYVLQILGCKTAVAFGGAMGLRVAQLFQPNLVFIDLGMPGADGCETLAAVRGLEGAVASAMFVCLTGRSDADEQRCLQAGFDRFVNKPMDAALLPELLAEARSRAAMTTALSPVQPTAADSTSSTNDGA